MSEVGKNGGLRRRGDEIGEVDGERDEAEELEGRTHERKRESRNVTWDK